MQTGSSWTLIGWKSGQTTFVPLWDWMEGAWLRTQDIIIVLPEENFNAGVDFEEDSGVFGKSMKTVQYLYKIFMFWLI